MLKLYFNFRHRQWSQSLSPIAFLPEEMLRDIITLSDSDDHIPNLDFKSKKIIPFESPNTSFCERRRKECKIPSAPKDFMAQDTEGQLIIRTHFVLFSLRTKIEDVYLFMSLGVSRKDGETVATV